ncbi:MAG: RHS repeat-associated core domain-containing protein [Bacteroidota bacterium]
MNVWEASYLPFGGVHTSTGANSELRFPGQWFQSEAGLHQNWMRDYDPTTGRYIQADPLGLVDGPSIYGYALQNPMRFMDPRGEQSEENGNVPVPLCRVFRTCRDNDTAQSCPRPDGFFIPIPGLPGTGLPGYSDPSELLPPPTVVENDAFPPGFWPGDSGSAEWGRRQGHGAKKGKEKFHKLKGQNKGSGANTDFGVNPETGDVVDGNGEPAGNLFDED